MWHRGGVPMALGRKRRWLVVSGVLAVTGLMMLSLWAAIPQEVRSRIAAAVQVHTRAVNLERKPLRYIKDPNPAWSSIAVNADNNMVVMTDENLFRVVEYSRLDNTPPKARFTEPKRIISGDQTRMEMLCGAYIDPKTLDVYVTNNDTQDWMPVFSRNAKGNVAPDRLLATPHRTWCITGDETRQELYMTIQYTSAGIMYCRTTVNTTQHHR